MRSDLLVVRGQLPPHIIYGVLVKVVPGPQRNSCQAQVTVTDHSEQVEFAEFNVEKCEILGVMGIRVIEWRVKYPEEKSKKSKTSLRSDPSCGGVVACVFEYGILTNLGQSM